MKIQSVQKSNINIRSKNVINNAVIQYIQPTYTQIYFSGGLGCAANYGQFSHTPKWSRKLLRVAERTESEMRDLAEYFHHKSDNEIVEIAQESHRWWQDSQPTVDRLIKFVKPLREAKLKMLKRISELEIKKALGISNATEQKTRLNREFISLIAAEKEGKNPPIKNGILVHGTSSKKEEFINWLTESAGAVVKTIQHDPKKPTKTIDSLIDIAENAEKAFKHSRTRTVIVIKDLDNMLSNKKSAEAMDNINEFKSIAEDLSQKYHTTIITSTDKPLDTFEPASIASNRLGVHVDLKDGISEEELKELGKLKTEVKRLDDKASQARNEFTS